MVVSCFDRFEMLTYMVRRYATLDIVHKIYVVWGDTKRPPFRPSLFNVSVEVEILFSGVDSLNDRFRPIESLQTEAVLICDDDVEVDLAALRTAFQR